MSSYLVIVEQVESTSVKAVLNEYYDKGLG